MRDQGRELIYHDGNQKLIGTYFQATLTSANRNGPCIMVAPDWSGVNEFALKSARKIVDHGYSAFVIDIYGDKRTGKSDEEKNSFMTPFIEKRLLLRTRLLSAYHTLSGISEVDSDKIGILGFCFGGLCALDLARAGAQIKAAVSFHGLLFSPAITCHKIAAKVLVLHGAEDPMVPVAQVLEFYAEMNRLEADWQFHAFSHTVHAFANPNANNHANGTVYHEGTAKRAWALAFNHFDEVF